MELATALRRSVSNMALLAAAAGGIAPIAFAQGTAWCPPQCPQSVQKQICYEAGRVDAYAAPFDPTTPRPFFASMLAGYSIVKQFDDPTVNAVCGTTFQNLPCGIVSARLEIQLRAEADIPSNDSIYLQWLGGTFAWGSNISALPGAGGTWNAGQTQTFNLNLGSLPGGLLTQMNTSGALDVLVSDDTTIEYARLTVTVCPCDGPARIYTVGTVDNMAAPTEPTSRRPRLTALRTTPPFLWKDNDDCTLDRGWGHTFASLPRGIVRADFTIRMQPCGGASNDSISFDLLNQGAPEAFSRGFNINTLAAPWVFPTNPLTNFYFDLGSTLPTAVCGSNLLGDFGDRTFDVYVQDDTGVDAARLRVWPCPPLRRFVGIPFDTIGSANIVQANARRLEVRNLGSSGEDGISIDAHGCDGQTISFDPSSFVNRAPGSDLLIATMGDQDGDDQSDVTGGCKVSFSDLSIMTVRPAKGSAMVGACTPVHLHNSVTGESMEACLSGGQGVHISGTEIEAFEWKVEVGEWISSLRLSGEFDMELPDGRRFRGTSVDFTEDELFATTAVESLHVTSGMNAAGTPSGDVAITGVAVAISSTKSEQAGGECVMNTNPGSITLSNIGSSGQDGITFHCPRAQSFSCDITPACAGTIEECAQAMAVSFDTIGQLPDGTHGVIGTARCAKRSEAEMNLGCLFSDDPSQECTAEVFDEAGTYQGSFQVTVTGARVIPSRGHVTVLKSCETTSAPRSTAFTFSSPVSYMNADGTVITGTTVRMAPPAGTPDAKIDAITMRVSGITELDITNQRIVMPGTGNPCPADFNQDGGVDGSDIDAFFTAWEAGDATADVNYDGGVDGEDVSTFFMAWENGGC